MSRVRCWLRRSVESPVAFIRPVLSVCIRAGARSSGRIPGIKVSTALMPMALLVGLSGCASIGQVTGGDWATSRYSQSETDATTSYYRGVHRVIVTYNDETGSTGTINYGPTSRQVSRGASLGGWSYSEDHGANWKYGGKLVPPRGWAAVWGDPAIVTSRTQYGTVFISNLAFPDEKFPAGGVNGPVNAVVGGACIFRSLDGGQSFLPFQCVTDKSPVPGVVGSSSGHFFDGGSMAAAPNGDIYAAYVDVDTSQIIIYRSVGGQLDFAPMPGPFASYYVASHPRIRVGPDGALFVMAVAKARSGPNPQYSLVVNRLYNGAWGIPKVLAFAAVYPDVDMNSSVLGAPLKVRTGPQFAFDIGARSEFLDDSVRFLVTQYNDRGWLVIRGGVCSYDLGNCGLWKGWTFGADTSQGWRQRIDNFNPAITAFPGIIFGPGPGWQASFLVRYGDSTTTVDVTRATLGYVNGSAFTIPVSIGVDRPVCPDLRGYWGDYDAHIPVEVLPSGVRYMRLATDSSAGCNQRWTYLGQSQHVRGHLYTY